MAFTTLFFFVALFCAALANPLGQTTVCETTPNINPFGPYMPVYPLVGPGSTTVCETTPNFMNGLGFGYFPPVAAGFNLLPPTIPGGGLLPYMPYPPASTTVCETVPNAFPYPHPAPYIQFGGLPLPYAGGFPGLHPF